VPRDLTKDSQFNTYRLQLVRNYSVYIVVLHYSHSVVLTCTISRKNLCYSTAAVLVVDDADHTVAAAAAEAVVDHLADHTIADCSAGHKVADIAVGRMGPAHYRKMRCSRSCSGRPADFETFVFAAMNIAVAVVSAD